MNIYSKPSKVLALLRWMIFRKLYGKGATLNFLFNARHFRRKAIHIGKKNYFFPQSKIITESRKKKTIEIGSYNFFSPNSCLFDHGGRISIRDHNFFGPNCQIQGRGGVTIGSKCMFAANTFISSSDHDIEDPTSDNYLKKEIPSPVIIDDFVWIGANTVITSGVTIGSHSIIGAGSVVTKNIPPYSIAYGSPAAVHKYFDMDQKKWSKKSMVSI